MSDNNNPKKPSVKPREIREESLRKSFTFENPPPKKPRPTPKPKETPVPSKKDGKK